MKQQETTTASNASTNIHQEYVHRHAWKAGMLGAINVLVLVTAVRLILLVSVCGAIGLAYLALSEPGPYRLGTLAIYATVVVVPLIWLSSRR
jgi:hypothetical protein